MKKYFLLGIILLFAGIINAHAQLKEVRGVLTKCVEYSLSGKTVHGFQFINENDYTIWVEAELCTHGFSGDYGNINVNKGVRDTKSFTLKPKESYIWRCSDKMTFSVVGNGWWDAYRNFYVQYKAYKAE